MSHVQLPTIAPQLCRGDGVADGVAEHKAARELAALQRSEALSRLSTGTGWRHRRSSRRMSCAAVRCEQSPSLV